MSNWKKDPSYILINTTYLDDLNEMFSGIMPGGKLINVGLPEVTKSFKFSHLDLVVN